MAESFDKYLELADVYAQSLFELARESGKIEDVRSELDELMKLCQIEPAFHSFITSSALDDDHREAGLEKLLRGKLSDITLNTLLVMNQHGRNAILSSLRRAYVIRQQDAAGQIEASVTSAVDLDESQKNEISATAALLSGKNPLIAYNVDPAILGGLILQMGGIRYDNSVASQLAEARKRVLERSERGLAVGVE